MRLENWGVFYIYIYIYTHVFVGGGIFRGTPFGQAKRTPWPLSGGSLSSLLVFDDTAIVTPAKAPAEKSGLSPASAWRLRAARLLVACFLIYIYIYVYGCPSGQKAFCGMCFSPLNYGVSLVDKNSYWWTKIEFALGIDEALTMVD